MAQARKASATRRSATARRSFQPLQFQFQRFPTHPAPSLDRDEELREIMELGVAFHPQRPQPLPFRDGLPQVTDQAI